MSRCFLVVKKKGEGEECTVQLFHYWGPFQYGEGGKYRNADIQKCRHTEMQKYRNTTGKYRAEIQQGNTGKKERGGAVCRFSITGGLSNTREGGVYCCLCRIEID